MTRHVTTDSLAFQTLGIDISKGWFDVFLHPIGLKERFNNNMAGILQFIRWLKPATVTLAVMDATGGLEVPLFNALLYAGYDVARLNPRWIRDFAKASGRSSKTDKQDARFIALYGGTMQPPPSRSTDQKSEEFRALCVRRRQILDMKTQETNHQKQTRDSTVARCTRHIISLLDKQLAMVETTIDTMIRQDIEWCLGVTSYRAYPDLQQQMQRPCCYSGLAWAHGRHTPVVMSCYIPA